ncbi:C-terminal processing protease CtpA/Prc, contains a PDZ domain [Pedobacter westerhofensis]|uniref:Tricorn protease homolog n=2 Tax=Pedobacter westerhofensis TaxID=425512 RepID=A0A521FR17_9SPHI|nr:C-terminal processing protease CtpA/Prc, contains a PDZ domain [Pedobacter westerhofensis]
MQQCAVSPDGKWVAFEYKGNIWKVSGKGGMIEQLTHGPSYSGYPVWSHDSNNIAFANDEHGNFDVYLMDTEGKNIDRLTFNSARDIPYDFSSDDEKIRFGTDRHDIYQSARFPGDQIFSKLYEVPISGGKSILVNSAGMDLAHEDQKGTRIIFQDKKGLENTYRKHHQSSVTRDIWVYDIKAKTYQQVSSFKGEDLEPIWGKGDEFYYLSERSGSMNVFKGFVGDTSRVLQLSSFSRNPVRNLSRSANGRLVFTYNGDLYGLTEGKEPQKLKVFSKAVMSSGKIDKMPVRDNITEMALSADGKQIAFICRGDIFVSAADGHLTKRITSTPFQERMVNFSPDGRKLLFSVEQENSWDIQEIRLKNSADAYFYNATGFTVQNIIATGQDEFQGLYSPDAGKIAYIENREVLKCYDLRTKTTRILIPEGVNYSSGDGDQYFSWSPDSQYLLAQSTEGGGGFENDVVLIKDDGSGKRLNLTQSGFIDEKPKWGVNGAMMYWLSDKLANHSFTLTGAHRDVFGMFFDHSLFDNLQESQLDTALNLKRISKLKLPNNLLLNKEGFPSARMSRVTADLPDALLSPDGKTLYSLNKYQENYDLWKTNIITHQHSLLAKLNIVEGKMQVSTDGRLLFILSKGNILIINTQDGKVSPIPIDTVMEYNTSAEREYLFRHTWQMVKKRFMFPDYGGLDWDGCYQNYKLFVKHINNDYDFLGLLNEFLGELNTSHTLARYTPVYQKRDQTAALGLLYDETWNKDGILVKEILKGGPFDLAKTRMKPDMLITAIDGQLIRKTEDWAALLNGKSGKQAVVKFANISGEVSYTDTVRAVKPETELNTLLYNRWIRQMEHLTDSLSHGKLGYVHVRSMNDEGFRPVYDKALGKYKNAAALIVDTRYNRGGSLHEQLNDFLSGKIYLTERRQGRITNGGEPLSRWNKPSCIIMNEGNYSDAYLTPYTYRRMGIGKSIGMPVPGTGTASWFETQINPSLTVQIGVGATYGAGEHSPTENSQIDPDIRVANFYQNILNGRDEQLETAVKEMLIGVK